MSDKTILHSSNMFPPVLGGGASPIGLRPKGAITLSPDFEINQRIFELEKQFPELRFMDRAAKTEFIQNRIKEWRAEIESENKKAGAARKALDFLKSKRETLNAISDWGESGLKLEKPDGPSFRNLRKAVSEGKTVYFSSDLYGKTPAHDFEKEVFRLAEVLVIEHDWAGAFKNTDISNATIKLPYEVCAFEFKFSGRPVIAFATQFETDIVCSPAIYCDGDWMLMDVVFSINEEKYKYGDCGWEGILILSEMINDQIRAACIALDAEVATSEVIREPHLSNHGKNNRQQLRPYHVVSLARRSPRPLPAASHETGRHVRLHFRRGHWRHFETRKTWIKWMLVGDPDLGFVDKHYKL